MQERIIPQQASEGLRILKSYLEDVETVKVRIVQPRHLEGKEPSHKVNELKGLLVMG